jgi:hypothetical protein
MLPRKWQGASLMAVNRAFAIPAETRLVWTVLPARKAGNRNALFEMRGRKPRGQAILRGLWRSVGGWWRLCTVVVTLTTRRRESRSN